MKAVVWLGPREMRLEEVADPAPGADEVVVRVAAVGICGSELSGYLGHNKLRVPPLVMGHEFTGEVVARGVHVNDLTLGDQVVVNPLISCGTCEFCRTGYANLCPRRQLVGAHRPGAFAEYVAVAAGNCTRMPADLSQVDGSLAEPLACGVRAARVGGIQAGTTVAIFGAGPIGLMCISACRRIGGEVQLVTDTNGGRLATATRWGAQATHNAHLDNSADAARHASIGHGVDVAIDAVGIAATRRAAIAAVRPGGTVVFLGLHEAESPVQANDIVRSEIRIVGSFAYTPADFAEAVTMLAGGEVHAAADWLEERPLDACADSFTQLIDAPSAIAKIVLRP
jgi:2-desacetyl-2-hydroxyethyl bacteriochlorophyllide A dehydrogenase